MAVKVMDVPLHTELLEALIDTAGVAVPTLIVIELDVAVVGDAQAELEVMTHVTVCPLVRVVVV
jgi:hypothetical protein